MSEPAVELSGGLTAVEGGAPRCEGSAHRQKTHGHDSGPARFRLVFSCPCGSGDDRLICAGRAQDLRARGVKCEGCGTSFREVDDVLTLTALEQAGPAPDLSAVPAGATVMDAFELDQRARGLIAGTVENPTTTVGAFERAQGVVALRATERDLLKYLGRPGVKKSTLRANRAALRAFYRFAHERGYRPDDPAAALPPIRVPRGQPRPFTREQIDRMLTSGAYRRTRAMILVGAYQGFRVSQIARVRGDDIDLDAMTIRTVGKGSKERTLPLHPVVAELALTMPRRGWWFPARQGRPGPIQPGSVTQLVADAKKRAGITDPRLTAHSLRHAFGTELVEGGVDIRVVQELMLHEDLSTTQIYTGVSEGRKSQALAVLRATRIPDRSGRQDKS